MNNFLEYFYNIKPTNITNKQKYSTFIYQHNLYKLYISEDPLNINIPYNICEKLSQNTLTSEIIKNINNEPITIYNNRQYLLLKLYTNPNKPITLEEISNLNKTLYTENLSINWGTLWSNKIDYLENLINENGKKYPLLVDSFNYYVGLAENAISYYNNITIPTNYKYYLTHKHLRLNDTVESLYNPLNLTFDYQVRDLAEYLKISFFNNNKLIFQELNTYLTSNSLSLTDIKLLISRLLYPSFYFDMYEDILIDNQEEQILTTIISKSDNYELYLYKIINYLKQYYDIDEIPWLQRKKEA